MLNSIIATSIFLFQVSNATSVFEIGSLDIEIINFVSRVSLVGDHSQGKLIFWFGMLNDLLGHQIFLATTFFLEILYLFIYLFTVRD